MQQGLRPYVQDENAMAPLHRLPAPPHLKGGTDENSGALASKSGLPGLGKALGGLTGGKASYGAGRAESGLAGKTPARRALGDITNSNSAAPSAQKGGQKAAPLSTKLAPALQQQSTIPLRAAVAPDSRADVLAEGGVERLAGWSWEQLEADRLARQDAEIGQRLRALANYQLRALPNFFPCWGAPAGAMQKDVLPTPPASPAAKQAVWSGAALALPDPDELILPDIALPDVKDAMEL